MVESWRIVDGGESQMARTGNNDLKDATIEHHTRSRSFVAEPMGIPGLWLATALALRLAPSQRGLLIE